MDIINICLSTPVYCEELYDSIKYAIDNGTIIICSSGNTGNEQKLYPSSFNIEGLISVGAIDKNLNVLPTTTFNDSVDVFAPGEDIFFNNPDTKSVSGTSLAVPIVTSLVILIKAKCPDLTPKMVENIIKENSNSYTVKWQINYKNIKVITFKKTLEHLKN
jgi:subtilisin